MLLNVCYNAAPWACEECGVWRRRRRRRWRLVGGDSSLQSAPDREAGRFSLEVRTCTTVSCCCSNEYIKRCFSKSCQNFVPLLSILCRDRLVIINDPNQSFPTSLERLAARMHRIFFMSNKFRTILYFYIFSKVESRKEI